MSATERRKPVIGIMGGIGAGKSTVAKYFAEFGCAVVDADALGRDALKLPVVAAKLREWWGSKAIGPDGELDRKVIAKIVFADKDQLARLENFVHPLVNEARLRLYDKYQKDDAIRAIVEDSPLLLEKGLDYRCDVLVFVEAAPETRLKRVSMARGWTAEELVRRQRQQIGLDIKAQRADYVIDNNDGGEECRSRVGHVLSQILQERA